MKRLVRKNHVGRHVVRLGEPLPDGAQSLEERSVKTTAFSGFSASLDGFAFCALEAEHLFFSRENARSPGCQLQNRVAVPVLPDKLLRKKLIDDEPPVVFVLVPSRAERLDGMVPEFADALRVRAHDDVDDVNNAEPLLRPRYGRQHYLRVNGDVDSSGFAGADIARAAVVAGISLAEKGEELLSRS